MGLTDAEIIKALECCQKVLPNCRECPIEESQRIMCCDLIKGYAINLINRLQADIENYKQIAEHQQSVTMDRGFEIKRLKAEVERLEAECEKQYEIAESTIRAEIADGGTSCHWCEDTIRGVAKTEAYKECVEKVKEEITEALKSNYKARAEREQSIPIYTENEFLSYCSGKIDCLRGIDDFLDNLLKELVGEDNG